MDPASTGTATDTAGSAGAIAASMVDSTGSGGAIAGSITATAGFMADTVIIRQSCTGRNRSVTLVVVAMTHFEAL